ncbi:MAG TPA: [FeFe] hydrogenase H-cluster radical SAM maturase HydE [Bacteroidales bacterium]|nr:[FeFe] hydrogenase H-cluster radical SAM maturase HydE [Bacteroidales bacterium]
MIEEILAKDNFSFQELVMLLSAEGRNKELLFERSAEVKNRHTGKKVYLRGLIELSNICRKDCLYCGIRKSNSKVNRYNISDEEILDAVNFALKSRYASIVLQSGELGSIHFTERIESLLTKINKISKGKLRITLSLGEQSEETYRRWFHAGAKRYLLRIETSNAELYKRLHPNDSMHSFEQRLNCLLTLKRIGYQTGTGVMIGLPFQTLDDLAYDLLFFKKNDFDMFGMGPYIEHQDTPLYQFHESLLPLKERLDLSLKMIAILRIMMKNVNIAATTALQAIDKMGREKALKIGANVIMPNITPGIYRNNYLLYQNKPCTDENADDCSQCLEARIEMSGNEIAWDEWGDSVHFLNREEKDPPENTELKNYY